MALVTRLSDQEKMALGYSALTTGYDIYAIHVRITNTGSVPVTVSPGKIRFTFNGMPLPLTWSDDDLYFQETELQPNRYTEGILTFKTAMIIAGAVLQNGRVSYQDSRVQVSY